MKTSVAFALVMTALASTRAVRAQQCYTPITSWQVKYSLSGSGTGACADGQNGATCTTNQMATGTDTYTAASVSCSSLQAGPTYSGTVTSASVNDAEQYQCQTNPPKQQTETAVGTGGSAGPAFTQTFFTINFSSGTYFFEAFPYGNATVTAQGCFKDSINEPFPLYPYTNWPLTFTLPSAVQPLNVSNFGFEGEGGLNLAVPWIFSFTLTPIYNDDDSCKQNGGSSIGCQNQSLGEDVPIVGTGFKLHYEGDRTPGAGGDSIASTDASMIGGWTLSVHHAYNPATNTLFLGDGGKRNGYRIGTPVSFNNNLLFTSEDGGEVYVFTSAGQHLQTRRPLTGALIYQFGYDLAGKLVKVTDAAGNVTSIERNASEQPTAIVSPYAQTTTLSLDKNGFLSHVTDPFGKLVTFINTSTGLLTSRTDANLNVYNYTYDSGGRLIRDADPAGGYTALTRTTATSGLGWTVEETTAMGRRSEYQSTITAPWVQTGTSTFSKQHTNTWPDGLQASSSTTQQGAKISESVKLPDGTSGTETLGPDPVWGIQVPIASSEKLTEGNLTMTQSASRSTTLSTAGDPFTVSTSTDTETINGRIYRSTFTGSTRTYVNTSPVGRTVTVGLDSLERLASTQVGGLTATDFAYDSRGRLEILTQGSRKATFAYDIDGRLASHTDPLGLKTSFTYDADGRLLTTVLADGRVIDYNHDGNGNLTAITPPGKSAHDFNYTSVNLMSEYLPPAVSGAGPTTYSYNADRDLTKMTRPDGKTVGFDYDIAGRLSSLITPTETIDYTYSATTGNLTSASITSGEALAYGYNGPLPVSTKWTGTIDGTVSRVYNNNFWVTSQSINGANTIAFSHDNDGLVTDAGALILKRSAQNGLITGTTLGLASDTRSYNSFGELTGYIAAYNGAPLYNVSSTSDAAGRVSGKTETIGGRTNTYVYSYDPAGRLTGVTQNGKSVSAYSYDTNSNRLKATTAAGTVSGTYDAQDRLLAYGAAAYTYTANGELENQTVGARKTAYQYDVLGNLTGVTLPTGTTISYVVDADNRRVGKKVNGVLVEGFLYDGDKIIAQLNGSNAIVSQFIYGTGSTAPDYMVSGGGTYRIFSDQLGSPRLVVNSSTGAIAEEITYDEFGNVTSDTKPGFQPFGFAGGLYDQDTKLVRFGARDYNPSIGRWTAKDPIRFAGDDTNLYGYVLNDPVNSRDSSGLQDENCACPNLKVVKSRLEDLQEAAIQTAQNAGSIIGGVAKVIIGSVGGPLGVVEPALKLPDTIISALKRQAELDDLAYSHWGKPKPCKPWWIRNQFWRQIGELGPIGPPGYNPVQGNPGYPEP